VSSKLKEIYYRTRRLIPIQEGQGSLDNFGEYLPMFKRIVPHDYKKMMNKIVQMEEKGLSSRTGTD